MHASLSCRFIRSEHPPIPSTPSPSSAQQLCDQQVDLVLTAHPTQALRGSLLKKYACVRRELASLHTKRMTKYEKIECLEAIKAYVQVGGGKQGVGGRDTDEGGDQRDRQGGHAWSHVHQGNLGSRSMRDLLWALLGRGQHCSPPGPGCAYPLPPSRVCSPLCRMLIPISLPHGV